MITYWIRRHCRWLRVTTDRATWARLPHVALGTACTVVAGALPLRPAEAPEMPVAVAEAPVMAEQTPWPVGSPWIAPGWVTRGGVDLGPVLPAPVTVGAPVDVPEPTSLGLLVVGVLAVLVGRRGRR